MTTLTLSLLSTLIKETAGQVAQATLKTSSPLFNDDSVLAKKDYAGSEATLTLFPPENTANSQVADGGDLPDGGADVPTVGRQLPENFIGVVKMGRAAADADLKDEQVTELFKDTLKRRSMQMARNINRAIYGTRPSPTTTAGWDTAASGGVATESFADISLFKPGMAVDFIDNSTGNTYCVHVTAVTQSTTSDIAGTVSFVNDIPAPFTGDTAVIGVVTALANTSIQTADSFALRGATGQGFGQDTATERMVSFETISGSGTLHGFSGSTLAGWVGNARVLSAIYSQEAMLAFGSRVDTFSGYPHTHVIMPPILAASHQAAVGQQGTATGGAGRFDVGKTADKYGSGTGLTMAARPVIEDPNCPATQVIFHNREWCKLGVWKKLGPIEEAGDPLLVGRTKYDVSYQIDGRYNLMCGVRSAIGRVTAVATSV